jgi:GNAT superfamily N-acetyltransferase
MSGVTRVSVEPAASTADIDVVQAGLRAFNVARIGEPHEEPVQIFLRDERQQVVGGLLGHIRWRWMYVAKLWIDASHRGGGHGTELMTAAEALARARDCIGVYLDTFEYQARPFYERLGYSVFGTLDGYPPGYCQHHLVKRFALPAPIRSSMPAPVESER